MVALAVLGTACAVSVDSDVALETETGAVAAPSPEPSPTPDFERNDEGDVLLPRTIKGEYQADECDFLPSWAEFSSDPECGWLIRPLHGATTDDVRLPVAVFKATGDDPQPDPIIYLHGGPSGGILSSVSWAYESVVEPFVEDRDVIIFDQRGTGAAEPDISCGREQAYFEWRSSSDDPNGYMRRTAKFCASNLEADGIRVNQFSRQSSADDVMVLARELGYEQVNLHGSSWGGILGYTVMQLHPEWVRSAVLDSPLTVDTDISGSMPGSFREAMQAVQTNCELDAACAERHGDIVERYVRVSDQLAEEPEPMTVTYWEDWTEELVFDADELSYLLFGLLYSPEAIVDIPDLLLELERGETNLAEELVGLWGWGWGFDFTFLAYMCSDFVSTATVEEIEAQQLGIPAFDRVDDVPDGRGENAKELCDSMDVTPPAAPGLREVTPTTPTIVFSGSMDPITPYSSGKRLIDGLPNGYFVGFQDMSHGITNTPCGIDIAREFINDPSTQPDMSCSLAENRPDFIFGGN